MAERIKSLLTNLDSTNFKIFKEELIKDPSILFLVDYRFNKSIFWYILSLKYRIPNCEDRDVISRELFKFIFSLDFSKVKIPKFVIGILKNVMCSGNTYIIHCAIVEGFIRPNSTMATELTIAALNRSRDMIDVIINQRLIGRNLYRELYRRLLEICEAPQFRRTELDNFKYFILNHPDIDLNYVMKVLPFWFVAIYTNDLKFLIDLINKGANIKLKVWGEYRIYQAWDFPNLSVDFFALFAELGINLNYKHIKIAITPKTNRINEPNIKDFQNTINVLIDYGYNPQLVDCNIPEIKAILDSQIGGHKIKSLRMCAVRSMNHNNIATNRLPTIFRRTYESSIDLSAADSLI